MNDRLDMIPAALYARVSSDRQDVDLSVAAQLRGAPGLRREERLPGRPRVRGRGGERQNRRPAPVQQDAGRGWQARGPLQGDPRLEVLPLHTQARARRRIQVHAQTQGREGRIHHRARRRLRHRKAHGGHHRERGRVLLGESRPRGLAGDERGRLTRLLGRPQRPLRLPQGLCTGWGSRSVPDWSSTRQQTPWCAASST